MRDDAASANPQANGSSPVVLFVGSHAHRVNREGVLDFVKRCWPAIRARVPHASFRIVGSAGWEAERDGLEKIAGVRVVGTVERLDEEYASAACCVVPVFEGSGTKIKVLEALLFGRPVVAAAHSTRGYDELVGKGLIRVEDDSQMIEACAGLLGEPSSRTSIASAGQRFVREHYSFDAFAKALGRGLEASGILPRSTQRTDETESASRLYPP
jgi:glycosyltransferase involved in cell wall biosynthesis